jgi:hypothetical protein
MGAFFTGCVSGNKKENNKKSLDKLKNQKSKLTIAAELAAILALIVGVIFGINQWKSCNLKKQNETKKAEQQKDQSDSTKLKEKIKWEPEKDEKDIKSNINKTNKDNKTKENELADTKLERVVLSISINEGDEVDVRGRDVFENAESSQNVKKFDVIKDEVYEVLVSNCPSITLLITKDTKVNRCK